MAKSGEYITAHEAQELLGISKSKMAQLIREEVLHTMASSLDKRIKLIRRADVEALTKPQPRPKENAA